ncbi:MAG: dethiobiotin synthase [Pseudomonadota bacterium]|nr:dethiobiotin synthase [Pseudomonadota bacterium]
MKNHGYFVTGTDTGVGKTCVSLALMRALQRQGHVVVGMKPVASGCSQTSSGLLNEDARQLQACASFNLPYQCVNPYVFEAAMAPHLAAQADGVHIEIPVIRNACQQLTAEADRVVVEGIGGWLVPINEKQTMADVALALGLPVVLVVAIRLGCLNQALLTAAAIRSSGLPLVGWVANRIDPGCEQQDGNVMALRQRLPAPLLADLVYSDDAVRLEQQAARIDLDLLPVA